MKKWFSMLTILFLICIAFCAVADTYEDDYESLVYFYNEATSNKDESLNEYVPGQNDPEKARENLESLIVYYESHQETLGNAQLYYFYARGRIAIYKEDYQTAVEYLGDCGNFGYDTVSYYSFARGMYLAGSSNVREDYPEAIKLLKTVQENKEFQEKCISTIARCKENYRAYMLAKAKQLEQKAQYENALEYLTEWRAFLPDDEDAKNAYYECFRLKDGTAPIEIMPSTIEITNIYAIACDKVMLQWKGQAEEYVVSYTMNMAQDDNWKKVRTTGEKYTATGLLPGTKYWFRVEDEKGNVSSFSVVQTDEAQLYSEICLEYKWTKSFTTYLFANKRDAFLEESVSSYEYYKKTNPKSIKDHTIALNNPAIQRSCTLFVFTTISLPEDMDGQAYTILLHIENMGTLKAEGMIGDQNVCLNDGRIYMLVYDLWDEAIEMWSDLSGKAYTIELLVDNALMARAKGKLQ